MDKQTANFLLASSIRRTNEGLPRRRRERIWPAALQAAGLLILAITLAVKL